VTGEDSLGLLSKTERRERALAEAIASHGRNLLSVIRGRIRDQGEAEDIAQEVFVEFLESYDLEQVIGSLGAWLYTVARNKILDRFRKKKNETAYREDLLAGTTTEPISASRPDEEWDRTLLRVKLESALELLPPEQREVFVKHELEGKSFQEISEETGVNVNTLLSRKHYALVFLRQYLKEVFDELE